MGTLELIAAFTEHFFMCQMLYLVSCITCVIFFNPQNSPVRQILILSSRRRFRGRELRFVLLTNTGRSLSL